MSAEETNRYKQDLAAAKGVIDAQRTLVTGDAGMGNDIRTKIATHEGWVCDAADDWITDFIAKCTPVTTEFDTAWTEVDDAWSNQPDKVDAGDWRGIRYNLPTGSYNIPV